MSATEVTLRSSLARPIASSWTTGLLQRKCACGSSGSTGCASCAEKEQKLQRRAISNGAFGNEAPPVVHDVLDSPGAPLDRATRNFFEPRFGHDFSQVRVHTDSKAAESAASVGSMAYTVGNHVVFGASRFAPSAASGRSLLAHELTHVVQQAGSAPSLHPKLTVGDTADSSEHEADTVAAEVMQGARLTTIGTQAPVLSRRVIQSGRILNEGDCAHLACNSKWACEDDTDGVTCPEGTRNDTSKTKHRFRPLFTCDFKCENDKTCSASEHYMAIPNSRFANSKCGQDLIVCTNGNFTHATVRDRSEREAWEVGPGVLRSLGVSRGDITDGAIYADETDADFKADKRCHKIKAKAEPDAKTENASNRAAEEYFEGGRGVPEA